ncbi:snaclec alboaggregin-A subunit alpha-like [Gopherus flavomarginatus]|uniref:snaclec alboaggregin-A subunit alpha-like n=1 Tax=Gopherus flavomarginatus TaxID=286002 RepID=UPI0021CBBEC2|nr:snaclec alboaggregin-A subunit alpha-like [Gopherus flavomarginatus]
MNPAAASSNVHSCPCTQGCCPAGWYQYRDSCYHPVTATKEWWKAEGEPRRDTRPAQPHSGPLESPRPARRTESHSLARTDCRDLAEGAHLASVHSAEENDFIYQLMGTPHNYEKKEAYWLGGRRDSQGEGSWRWTDGSAWHYHNFRDSKPDRTTAEEFVATWKFDQDAITWNNYEASWQFMSVCKRSLD